MHKSRAKNKAHTKRFMMANFYTLCLKKRPPFYIASPLFFE